MLWSAGSCVTVSFCSSGLGEIEKEIGGDGFSLFGLHNEEQTICFRCVIACIGVSKRTRDNADEQRDTKECG